MGVSVPDADVLLRGGTVVDGTGAPRYTADVAISGGRIAAVGKLSGRTAARVVDLNGLAIAPGFIDVHTHDDRLLLVAPGMAPKVSQGVTTVVVGNCGISLAPLGGAEAVPPLDLLAADGGERFSSLAGYLAALDSRPAAVNCAALVGHTTLRVVTLRDLGRAAEDAEIYAMQGHVREALAAGAIGVSTGTFYGPANAATAEEVRRVCEPLRGTTAVIASHIRDEAEGVVDAMREVFAIARELGVRQILSHHKVYGPANSGRSYETLSLFDAARREGDVGLDCYPYAAGSTILRKDMVLQARRVMIAWSTARPDAAGRFLDELAAEAGLSPDATIDALQPAGAIYFSMDEADVERILGHPETMVGSDGLPHDAFPHPRLWGTFPRVLGHYVRERGLFSLEAAVRKMTSLPADRFRLAGRGRVEPGYRADLTVFDPERVADTATYSRPISPAAGIASVWVNGVETWHDGEPTGARAGQVIRRH
jgi:N-acyl-D-amino-acid deacylase